MAKVRGKDFNLDFATSPNNVRYYYATAGRYAEATAG